MRIADFRSDTITRPTPEMYAAMASAPLGDDVLGDDPSVIELETVAAQMSGKECALFVPSGTMGNQISIAAQTCPGDAVLCEQEAHIVYYEVGAPAVLSNVLTMTMPSENGVILPETIINRITQSSLHTPGTTLLCYENSHNRAGGTVVPQEIAHTYRTICDEHGMRLHMDGARAFNAAVHLNMSLAEVLAPVHTASLCLSKGLCSPVGSVVVGDEHFIAKARVWRKRLGGGMRQAGLLAACGLVSLRSMVHRLAEDHALAKALSIQIGRVRGFTTHPELCHTNICLVSTEAPAEKVVQFLKANGVICFPVAKNRIRLVTHADVCNIDVNQVVEAFVSFAESTPTP